MPQPMGHYLQAVRVGNLLFVAGQPGIDLVATADPATARAVPGGFEAEFRQAVRNLEAVLKAAGSDLQHVVMTTTFMTDLENGEVANRLYAEYSQRTRRRGPRRSSRFLGGCSCPSRRSRSFRETGASLICIPASENRPDCTVTAT